MVVDFANCFSIVSYNLSTGKNFTLVLIVSGFSQWICWKNISIDLNLLNANIRYYMPACVCSKRDVQSFSSLHGPPYVYVCLKRQTMKKIVVYSKI